MLTQRGGFSLSCYRLLVELTWHTTRFVSEKTHKNVQEKWWKKPRQLVVLRISVLVRCNLQKDLVFASAARILENIPAVSPSFQNASFATL